FSLLFNIPTNLTTESTTTLFYHYASIHLHTTHYPLARLVRKVSVTCRPLAPLAEGLWDNLRAGNSERLATRCYPSSKEQTRGLREGGSLPSTRQSEPPLVCPQGECYLQAGPSDTCPSASCHALLRRVQLPGNLSLTLEQLFGAPGADPSPG
uniref:Uncharacterized protein n=1 Tax=Catharus ustulatus TaxID=91951 RepID=A0A8C3UUB9_CATUS